jgi:ribonucleoside-diphosphate reductase beta chain
MAIAFGSQETIHATAYSYLNETLGLEDFAAFMHEPTIAAKFEFLLSTESDYTPEDLLKSAKARKEAARSLAIFSAFAEGVSLYSSFPFPLSLFSLSLFSLSPLSFSILIYPTKLYGSCTVYLNCK